MTFKMQFVRRFSSRVQRSTKEWKWIKQGTWPLSITHCMRVFALYKIKRKKMVIFTSTQRLLCANKINIDISAWMTSLRIARVSRNNIQWGAIESRSFVLRSNITLYLSPWRLRLKCVAISFNFHWLNNHLFCISIFFYIHSGSAEFTHVCKLSAQAKASIIWN